MKNYRYHVVSAIRKSIISTHRNPLQAFKAAHYLARETPNEYEVKDTATGGSFITGTPHFKAAWGWAKDGDRNLDPNRPF